MDFDDLDELEKLNDQIRKVRLPYLLTAWMESEGEIIIDPYRVIKNNDLAKLYDRLKNLPKGEKIKFLPSPRGAEESWDYLENIGAVHALYACIFLLKRKYQCSNLGQLQDIIIQSELKRMENDVRLFEQNEVEDLAKAFEEDIFKTVPNFAEVLRNAGVGFSKDTPVKVPKYTDKKYLYLRLKYGYYKGSVCSWWLGKGESDVAGFYAKYFLLPKYLNKLLSNRSASILSYFLEEKRAIAEEVILPYLKKDFKNLKGKKLAAAWFGLFKVGMVEHPSTLQSRKLIKSLHGALHDYLGGDNGLYPGFNNDGINFYNSSENHSDIAEWKQRFENVLSN
jgi:hypothetical protein